MGTASHLVHSYYMGITLALAHSYAMVNLSTLAHSASMGISVVTAHSRTLWYLSQLGSLLLRGHHTGPSSLMRHVHIDHGEFDHRSWASSLTRLNPCAWVSHSSTFHSRA